jgi:D-alanyl-D-alanine carboxypeptidase/D-alanyl-D-alanine-endopeptidase (penicillin-binding protein 4)
VSGSTTCATTPAAPPPAGSRSSCRARPARCRHWPVDANRWRRDAAFLADPALPAAGLFRDYLVAEGVAVLGGVVREARPQGAYTVASFQGGTLSTAVTRTLKASDNFVAEMLLKELGRGVRADGSSAGGLAAVRSVLGGQGVPVGAGSDGSGLSALDRQSAAGQVKLLQLAERSNVAPAFRSALPLGCRDGTLRRRFCRTAAEGRVWAKTGTISGVRALSGMTRTASGRQVQFTFQLSGVGSGAKALAAMDRAVVVLASSRD